MVELVTQLAEVTDILLKRLEQVTEEEIVTFLDEREVLIERMKLDQLSPDDRDRYRAKVMDILRNDQKILAKLNVLRQEALEGMSKLEEGKRQKSAYDTHYSYESIYFDRTK